MFTSFVSLEIACLLRLVVAAYLIAGVPSNVNIMNQLFVLFEVTCFLCLVVASALITVVPLNVNIMNILFV